MQRALAGKDCHLLSRIQDFRGCTDFGWCGNWSGRSVTIGCVMGDISFGSGALLYFEFLKVNGYSDVRYAAVRKRGPARQIQHIFHVIRAHHALVVDADVHE